LVVAIKIGTVKVESEVSLVLSCIGNHGFDPEARLEILDLKRVMASLFLGTRVELED
jgi:hypothetical protein